MRRYVTLLIVPVLSLLAVWAASCRDNLRENLPVRPYDLAPASLDLSQEPPDLTAVPDMKSAMPDAGPDAMPQG